MKVIIFPTGRFLISALLILMVTVAISQNGGSETQYLNEKYRFSFSYPSQYVLNKISDRDWQIHDADNTWGVGFSVFNLDGGDYEAHIRKISAEIISANGLVSRPPTATDRPELKKLRDCLVPGFNLDKITFPLEGTGNSGLEKMANAQKLELNVLKKRYYAGFTPDGIMVYFFSLIFDFDKVSDKSKALLARFEETIQFAKWDDLGRAKTTPTAQAKVAVAAPKQAGSDPKPNINVVTGKFRDPREGGETYNTIKIGDQIWMSENLNESRFRNGDLIAEAATAEAWKKAGEEGRPVWCYYNYDATKDDYGKLYNWYAVNDPRGLAPAGWQVPADSEWTKLNSFLGGGPAAAIKMTSDQAWTVKVNASNTSGFEALPSGYCIFNGQASGLGLFGCWWTATEVVGKGDARYVMLYFKTETAQWTFSESDLSKTSGFSVRCVKQ